MISTIFDLQLYLEKEGEDIKVEREFSDNLYPLELLPVFTSKVMQVLKYYAPDNLYYNDYNSMPWLKGSGDFNKATILDEHSTSFDLTYQNASKILSTTSSAPLTDISKTLATKFSTPYLFLVHSIFFKRKRFFNEHFSDFNEFFISLCIPQPTIQSKLLSLDNERMKTLEKKLSNYLIAKHLGTAVGHAANTSAYMIILAVVQPEFAIPIIQNFARTVQVPRESFIIFHDADYSHIRISVWDNLKPPVYIMPISSDPYQSTIQQALFPQLAPLNTQNSYKNGSDQQQSNKGGDPLNEAAQSLSAETQQDKLQGVEEPAVANQEGTSNDGDDNTMSASQEKETPPSHNDNDFQAASLTPKDLDKLVDDSDAVLLNESTIMHSSPEKLNYITSNFKTSKTEKTRTINPFSLYTYPPTKQLPLYKTMSKKQKTAADELLKYLNTHIETLEAKMQESKEQDSLPQEAEAIKNNILQILSKINGHIKFQQFFVDSTLYVCIQARWEYNLYPAICYIINNFKLQIKNLELVMFAPPKPITSLDSFLQARNLPSNAPSKHILFSLSILRNSGRMKNKGPHYFNNIGITLYLSETIQQINSSKEKLYDMAYDLIEFFIGSEKLDKWVLFHNVNIKTFSDDKNIKKRPPLLELAQHFDHALQALYESIPNSLYSTDNTMFFECKRRSVISFAQHNDRPALLPNKMDLIVAYGVDPNLLLALYNPISCFFSERYSKMGEIFIYLKIPLYHPPEGIKKTF